MFKKVPIQIQVHVFYDEYNYEPDEQKKDVQNKSIQEIEHIRTWVSYYKENKKNSIIDISEIIITDLNKLEYFI